MKIVVIGIGARSEFGIREDVGSRMFFGGGSRVRSGVEENRGFLAVGPAFAITEKAFGFRPASFR